MVTTLKDFIIRDMLEEDIPKIYEAINLKYVEKYCDKECEQKAQWLAYKKWYYFIMNSSYFFMYIVTNNENQFLGNVKFEIHSKRAILEIYLIEKIRGRNYSPLIIEESILRIKEKFSINKIEAYIIKENSKSKYIFKKLDFKFVKITNYNGVKHDLYVKKNI
ncbi:MAG: GNAT family N-acetyltransferase [Fusobacteriaceae bacterium]